MAVVCERVRLAIGAVSVVLFTLGVGGTWWGTWTVCTMQLVHLDLRWIVAVLVWPVALERRPLEVSLGVGLPEDGA